MKFKTIFRYEAELEPETFSKIMLLGFNLWHFKEYDRWFHTNSGGLRTPFDQGQDNMGFGTAEEAAIAGIKYYTAGNKP